MRKAFRRNTKPLAQRADEARRNAEKAALQRCPQCGLFMMSARGNPFEYSCAACGVPTR